MGFPLLALAAQIVRSAVLTEKTVQRTVLVETSEKVEELAVLAASADLRQSIADRHWELYSYLSPWGCIWFITKADITNSIVKRGQHVSVYICEWYICE